MDTGGGPSRRPSGVKVLRLKADPPVVSVPCPPGRENVNRGGWYWWGETPDSSPYVVLMINDHMHEHHRVVILVVSYIRV